MTDLTAFPGGRATTTVSFNASRKSPILRASSPTFPSACDPGTRVVVVYRDSPATDRPPVAGLTDWARDLEPKPARLMVDLYEPDRNAPAD
jgi:hypothetical protein